MTIKVISGRRPTHCSCLFVLNLASTSTGTSTSPQPMSSQPQQQQRISSEFFDQAMASALSANSDRNDWQVGFASLKEL